VPAPTYPDDLIPPEDRIFVGRGDFKAIGTEFLRAFVELGGLEPDHHVLDVGCGIGRMAVPLTGYLSAAGHYEGFDIVADGIEWCNENIAARHPQFGFRLVDLFNKRYNPGGSIQPREFVFPYADSSFDFGFATSVFTHMLPEDVEHYLDEIDRVLRPGGRTLVTFFLLNDESQGLIAAGRSRLTFAHELGVCRVQRKDIPEAVVAYPEELVTRLFEQRGFEPTEVHHGGWCGRETFTSQQDIVVATKR
jgi:SAM-dependent methyltransferase